MSSEKYTLVEGGILVETRLAEGREEAYPLFLDATALRGIKDKEERNDKAGTILKYLVESDIYGDEEENPDISIGIGLERRGYGIYGMSAEIMRPAVSDRDATLIATRAMRSMAYDLGTYSKKAIPGMVYAQILTESGMSFETNPVASSSMDTDGMEYEADSDRITLHSHNLYTHEMQLICISGIIALVKAG